MNNLEPKFKEVSDIRYSINRQKITVEEATKRSEKFLASHLEESEAYEIVGEVLMFANKHESAVKPLLVSLGIDDKNVSTRYLLGFCYSVLADWGNSFLHLDRVNKLLPNHPEVLRCLGFTMSEMGKKNKDKKISDTGLDLLFKATLLAPNDLLIRKDLASSLMVQGRFREGVDTAKRVLDEEPNDSDMLHVLDFYNKLPNTLK